MSARKHDLLRPALSLLTAAAAFSSSAYAANFTWNGLGANDNWGTALNWQGGTAPTSQTSTIVLFGGSTRLTPLIDSPWTVGGMTFLSGAGAFTLSGTTLTLAASSTIANSSANLQTISNSSIVLSGASVWNAAAGDLSVTSAISGAGSITKTGTGVLVLSGSNTYTGSTAVNNGTLRLGSNYALPAGRPPVVNATTAGGSATVDLNGYSLSISSLTLGGSTARANATNTVTTGAGMLTLGGDISYVWATLAANDPGAAFITGNLNLGSAGRIISVLDSTKTTTELTISANISGAGSGLTKTDAGTLVLSGTNTYTGSTIVSGGVLRVGSASSLPSTTNLQLNGGVLELAGDLALTYGTGAGQMRWTGSGGFSAFGGDRTVNYNSGAAVTWGTNFVTNSAPLILSSAAADSKVTFGNNINLGATTRTVVVNNGSADVDAALSGVLSNGSMTVTGPGSLLLSGLNTYTGVTTINGNATAIVTTLADGGVASSLGASGTASSNLVINNATLKYTGTGGSTNRLFQIGTTASGVEAIIDASGVASGTNDGAIVFSNTGAIGYGTTARTRLLTLSGTNAGNNTLRRR